MADAKLREILKFVLGKLHRYSRAKYKQNKHLQGVSDTSTASETEQN
jgi:hypothetical protein